MRRPDRRRGLARWGIAAGEAAGLRVGFDRLPRLEIEPAQRPAPALAAGDLHHPPPVRLLPAVERRRRALRRRPAQAFEPHPATGRVQPAAELGVELGVGQAVQDPADGTSAGAGRAAGVGRQADDANADAASRRRRRRAPEQGPSPEQVGLAAALCYRDAESDEQIARRLGIARRTLARWKRRPDFAAAALALVTFQGWELGRGRKHPEKI